MRALTLLSLLVLAGAACPRRGDSQGAATSADAGVTAAAPPPASRFEPQPAGKRVAVLYTASVQGYVEPCGCTGDPLGGVARLGALVAEARRAYGDRVLFVDGGDLLFERADDTSPVDACQAAARADLLLASYARFGLAGTVLGPLDDVRGAAFRDARLAKHGVQTVGVNTARAIGDGARATASFVVDAGGAPVGVTAFRVDAPDQAEPARAALAAEVQSLLARGALAIIVLAQAPRAVTERVLAGVPGVDVVIQARAPGEVPVPPKRLATGATLVAAGQQAQHVGVLELVLDGRDPRQPLPLDDRRGEAERRRKVLTVRVDELARQVQQTEAGARRDFLAERLASARAELETLDRVHASAPLPGPHVVARAVPLPRGSAEDAQAKAELDAYTKSVPALVATCEASAPCPEPAAGDKTFVGAAVCQRCHAAAHAFWSQQSVRLPGKDDAGRAIERELGHARAWQTLTAPGKGHDKDRSCVGCHSVGFGVAGGACKTSDIVTKGLAGVQCESCHGAGSAHAASAAKADIVGSPPEATCRSCHKVPHIPTTESFVFGAALQHILGPGHGAP